MREIEHCSARRRARRILLAAGVGLVLAVPATSGQAALAAALTCTPPNSPGITYSSGPAANGTPTVCPPVPAGGSTGHKVG